MTTKLLSVDEYRTAILMNFVFSQIQQTMTELTNKEEIMQRLDEEDEIQNQKYKKISNETLVTRLYLVTGIVFIGLSNFFKLFRYWNLQKE